MYKDFIYIDGDFTVHLFTLLLLVISNYYTNGKSRYTQGGEILKTNRQSFPDILILLFEEFFTHFEGAFRSRRKVLFSHFTHPDGGTLFAPCTLLNIHDGILLCLKILELEKVVASLSHFIHTRRFSNHRTLVTLLDVLLMDHRNVLPQHDKRRLHIFIVGVLERLDLFPTFLKGHVKLLQIKEIEHMELELQGVSLESARKFFKVEVGVKRFTIDILTLLETLTENLSPEYNLTSPRDTPIFRDK